jgi:arginase family enzyme
MNKKFIHNASSEKEANVIAFGVPLGKNSKKMLSSLRETNWFVESFNLEKRENPLEKVKVYDTGDIKIKNNLDNIFQQTFNISKKGKIPLALGKSHLLTLYTLGGVKERTRIVIFDAHADLANEYFDEKIAESVEGSGMEGNEKAIARFNCYTWLRRYCELVGAKNVCLLGLRACSEEELKFIEENKILCFTSAQIKKDLKKVKEELAKFVGDSDVYVSLDIDFFDPSIAPAVDHPEPNGLFFSDFLEILEVLKGKIIGFDVVEINPIEGNKVTEFLAIKTIFEILGNVKLAKFP